MKFTGTFLVGLLAFLLAGCGGNVSVKGTVTAKGKPVVWGNVILVDASGQYHQADIELDGTFTLANVPSGTAKVGVTSPNPVDPRTKGRGGKGGGAAPGKGAGASDFPDPREKLQKEPTRPLPPDGAWFPLPNAEKLSDPMQSGLTVEVQKGVPLVIDIK